MQQASKAAAFRFIHVSTIAPVSCIAVYSVYALFSERDCCIAIQFGLSVTTNWWTHFTTL
jgi:hypothetical protein